MTPLNVLAAAVALLVPRVVAGLTASSAAPGHAAMNLRLNLLSAGGTAASAGMPMLPVDSHPLLTWELPPSVARQACAAVTVRDSAGQEVYSRPCHSTREQNATLELQALREASVYSVTVVVQPELGGANVTSAPLQFFTALRDWTAQPVWVAPCLEGHGTNESDYVWLRASLRLPVGDPVVSAVAFVSAEAPLNLPPDGCCEEKDEGSKVLGAYKLHVGGQLVGIGPGRPRCGAVAQGACEQTTPYDGFALNVSAGAPSIEVLIQAYGQNQPSVFLTQRVILELVVRTRSGGMHRLATGDAGRWEGFDADCPACSLMNPSGNSGGRFGSGYWYYYPHENPDARCLPGGEGGRAWADEVVIKPPFRVPLAPKPVPPIAISTKAARELRKVSPGLFRFQLDSEVQGGVRLRVANSSLYAGATATVRVSEQLDHNGSVRVPMYTGATYVSNFSLEPGAWLEHHEYMNFRFGEVVFTDSEGQPLGVSAADFSLDVWVVHYPYEEGAATVFNSSSADLNAVWWLTQNSVRYLSLDLYSDSNARQRSDACQADAATACQAQFATTPELALPRQQMQMIMDFSHVKDHTPWPFPPPADPVNGTGGYVSQTWADWTVLPAINVVNDALYTGDLVPGAAYLDDLVRYHLYLDLISGPGNATAGLVRDAACREAAGCLSALIDTSGGSDDSFVPSHVNAVVQAWVYFGLRQVARLARWVGREGVAAMLDGAAASLKEAFNRLLVNSAGVVCDGLCDEVNHTSIHSSFYAMAFGLVDAQHTPGAFAYISERIARSPVGFPGGSYPVQFLLLALYGAGLDHGQTALQVLTSPLKHSWLAMMRNHSATTTMECWSPDELPNLSFSHIWSASPSFIIPWYLAGVQPLTPGWTKLAVKPQPGTLTAFTLVLPTIKGPVTTAVTQRFVDGAAQPLAHFHLSVIVPGNVVARLFVPRPSGGSRCILLNKRQVTLSLQTVTERHVWVEVGAGSHEMEWC